MNNVILKNILVVLGLATVAFAGYYLYTQKDSTVLSGTDNDLEYQGMLLDTQVFIERRRELNEIEIDTGIFEDNRFRSLRKQTDPVDKQVDVGRTDPFAKISSGS